MRADAIAFTNIKNDSCSFSLKVLSLLVNKGIINLVAPRAGSRNSLRRFAKKEMRISVLKALKLFPLKKRWIPFKRMPPHKESVTFSSLLRYRHPPAPHQPSL